MREDKIETINGVEYTIHHFPATQALTLGLDLLKKAAPMLAPIVAPFVDDQGGEVEVTGEMLEKAAQALAEHLAVGETVALVKALVANTEAKGSGLLSNCFDVHFAGRLGDLVPLLAAVLQHNFQDFFSSALAGAQKAAPALKSLTA